jgi:hypothetical protein
VRIFALDIYIRPGYTHRVSTREVEIEDLLPLPEAMFHILMSLHGLLSFSVSQRTQEIGVRMALGAKSGQILSLILGESSRLAIAGVVLGAGLGYGAPVRCSR